MKSGLRGIQEHEMFSDFKYFKGESKMSFIETFFNFQDATTWLEHHLDEYDKNEWVLEDLSIKYLGGAYRVGVLFSKVQGDLFDE